MPPVAWNNRAPEKETVPAAGREHTRTELARAFAGAYRARFGIAPGAAPEAVAAGMGRFQEKGMDPGLLMKCIELFFADADGMRGKYGYDWDQFQHAASRLYEKAAAGRRRSAHAALASRRADEIMIRSGYGPEALRDKTMCYQVLLREFLE